MTPLFLFSLFAAVIMVACGETPSTDEATPLSTTIPAATVTIPVPESTSAKPPESTATIATTTTWYATTSTVMTTTGETTTATVTTTTVPETDDVDGLDTANPGYEGAAGSGCTPGTDVLPDGEWWGFVDSVSGNDIAFDLACLFVREAAIAAAGEDGFDLDPDTDPVTWVRNDNPRLRTIIAPDHTLVSWLANTGDPSTRRTETYAEWVAGRASRVFQPDVWITIANGELVFIEEQWAP